MSVSAFQSRESTMNKIDEVPEVDEFLAGALVNWFASCLEMITDEKLTYDGLVNGYLMHNVFLQMNLQVHDTNVYPSTIDSAPWRIRNLEAVLANVRHFYEDKLGQAILRLPDVEKLGREPEDHVREAELLLQLLLGCAVQCPKKQEFIERIMRMDKDSKMAVMECIKPVIEVPGIVLSPEMLANLPQEQIIERVRQICQERDEYETQLHRRLELEAEQLNDELKHKVASLEEQLGQKSGEFEDTFEELLDRERQLQEMTRKYQELALEAKNVNYYRDELDVAAEKAERLEQEVARYRKKLVDFDNCRARLKDFEKSNKDLTESKAGLVKQVASQKTEKDKTIRDLRRQVTKLTEQMSNLTAESAENLDKYWIVCQEKTKLEQLVKASYKNRSGGIPSLKDNSLLDQANSQLAKLRSDNDSLSVKLNQTLYDKSTLAIDNKKLLQIIDDLKKKMNSLSGDYNREANRSKTLGYISQAALNEAKKLHQQKFENYKPVLENSSALKNPTAVVAEPKCNVFPSRKLLKYVKTQA